MSTLASAHTAPLAHTASAVAAVAPEPAAVPVPAVAHETVADTAARGAREGWSDAQWDAWAATTTEEERFAALKAAIDKSRAEYDAGNYIEISSKEELSAFIDGLSEKAGLRVRAKRDALKLAQAS